MLPAVIVTACSMTKLTSVGKDPAYQRQPHKIMVIAVAKKPVTKRVFEDEFALMETNLYDAGNDKLVWSASSETEVRGSDQNQIRSHIGVMVNAMADRKLLR
jgi:hypothetical protein